MRIKCQIWSRVVGYLRPVDEWNEGKQSEFANRKMFDVEEKRDKPQMGIKPMTSSLPMTRSIKTELLRHNN